MTSDRLPTIRRARTSRARWLVVAVGGLLVTYVFESALVWLGLSYASDWGWNHLREALVLVGALSAFGATVVVGALVRLRGRREWSAAFGIVVVVSFGPGLVYALVRGM